jgi:hypothetical protein
MMRRALWSFWSKPLQTSRRSSWLTPRHHLLSWVLSFETISKHFPETALVTDDDGACLLVDQLGLSFTEVSTELNAMEHHDPGFWSLGKLYSYRIQKEPFIHFDSDLYLWKSLPENLLSAPVVAQNPEPEAWYRPAFIEQKLSDAGTIWLPAEWVWYRVSGPRKGGDCAGVFGGNHIDFIRYFSEQAIKICEHPDNQAGWAPLKKAPLTTHYGQYYLAACVEYHRQQPASPFYGIEIRYVFDSMAEAYNPERAAQLGFTHLLAGSKRDPEIARRLEARVKQDYPQSYERCVSLAPDRGKQESGPRAPAAADRFSSEPNA